VTATQTVLVSLPALVKAAGVSCSRDALHVRDLALRLAARALRADFRAGRDSKDHRREGEDHRS